LRKLIDPKKPVQSLARVMSGIETNQIPMGNLLKLYELLIPVE